MKSERLSKVTPGSDSQGALICSSPGSRGRGLSQPGSQELLGSKPRTQEAPPLLTSPSHPLCRAEVQKHQFDGNTRTP